MSRVSYRDTWTPVAGMTEREYVLLDPDPLRPDAPQPERRESRRAGCSAFTLLLIVLLAASVVPGRATVAAEPEPSGEVGTVLIGGWATWFDVGPGHYAAAGPVLRDVLGDWRGRYVTVEAGDRSVTVQLTDWCACGERGGTPTLLDLSRSAFAALGDPSLGVIRVSIEIDGSTRPDPRDDAMRDEVRDPLPATSTVDES